MVTVVCYTNIQLQYTHLVSTLRVLRLVEFIPKVRRILWTVIRSLEVINVWQSRPCYQIWALEVSWLEKCVLFAKNCHLLTSSCWPIEVVLAAWAPQYGVECVQLGRPWRIIVNIFPFPPSPCCCMHYHTQLAPWIENTKASICALNRLSHCYVDFHDYKKQPQLWKLLADPHLCLGVSLVSC